MSYLQYPPFMPDFAGPPTKTRYVYRTADNSCPNKGAPPSGPGPLSLSNPMPLPGPPPPPQPYAIPFGAPTVPQGMMCFPGSSYAPANPNPGYHYFQPPPSAPAFAPAPVPAPGPAPAPTNPMPPPYPAGSAPPAQQPFQATGQRKPPPKGCRVQGELPVYPGGKPPVLHSQKMCTIHLIKVASGQQGPWNTDGSPNKQAPAWNTYEFQPFRVATNMTIQELLDGMEIAKDYPAEWPPQCIGVAEGLVEGTGWYIRGSVFYLGDDFDKLSQTLEQVGWTADRGEAGLRPPVVLFMLP